MALGQKRRNLLLVPNAWQGIDRFKQEVATELGVQTPTDGYMGDIPSRVNGAIGGHMVRRMIAAAEQSLITQAATNVSTGFRSALAGSNLAGGQAGGYAGGTAGGGNVSGTLPSEANLFPKNV